MSTQSEKELVCSDLFLKVPNLIVFNSWKEWQYIHLIAMIRHEKCQ